MSQVEESGEARAGAGLMVDGAGVSGPEEDQQEQGQLLEVGQWAQGDVAGYHLRALWMAQGERLLFLPDY